MCGGSAACSAVICVFRLVTAGNSALLLPSGGDDGQVSVLSVTVIVFAVSVRFCFPHFLRGRGSPA